MSMHNTSFLTTGGSDDSELRTGGSEGILPKNTQPVDVNIRYGLSA